MPENTPEFQEEKAKQQKISQKSVMNYLMVLFAAAFCLLILTLLMEKRTNDEIVDTLSDQVQYAQTNHTEATNQRDKLELSLTEAENLIAKLEEENDQLTDANTQLEAEKSQLEQTLIVADESSTRADKLRVAMEQLENIETLCQMELYEDALVNIENFEQTSAFESLKTQTQPIYPVWGDPLPSPWEQYEALKTLVAEHTAD